jgi:ribose 5-phosphate isomerase B
MKVAIASDHAGYELKENLAKYLRAKHITVKDFGTYNTDSVDYPDYARVVAKAVAGKHQKYGILICGTGIGMSMAANKVKGIRAALCHNVYTAAMARMHNDANVLAIGARVIKPSMAKKIADTFISTPFEGGRHKRRVKKIG